MRWVPPAVHTSVFGLTTRCSSSAVVVTSLKMLAAGWRAEVSTPLPTSAKASRRPVRAWIRVMAPSRGRACPSSRRAPFCSAGSSVSVAV